MRMAEDPRVDLAIAVRGGYGWSRLLDRIDFGRDCRGEESVARPQRLHRISARRAGARRDDVSFAGPMAAYDFGAATPSSFTLDHCWGLLGSASYEVECALAGPRFRLEGTLWGGNLAMVAHLVGTPHLPRWTAASCSSRTSANSRTGSSGCSISCISPASSGGSARFCSAGSTASSPAPTTTATMSAAVVEHARARFGVPIYTGLPFGHCRDKLTLPVGGHCRADGARRRGAASAVRLRFLRVEPASRSLDRVDPKVERDFAGGTRPDRSFVRQNARHRRARDKDGRRSACRSPD